ANLDEFFAVRMAELNDQAVAGVARTAPDGRSPTQTLVDARRAIVALQASQDALWRDDLRPRLAAAGIRISRPADCRPRELRALRKRIKREVFPLLTPIALGQAGRFPPVQSLGLNLAVVAGVGGASRFVCI